MAKKKEPKRVQRIVSTGTDGTGNHRRDFKTCPYCEWKAKEIEEWDKTAATLITAPLIWKTDSIAVMSECPNCFKGSWVHHRLDSFHFSDWPEKWKETAEKISDARKLQALREWAASLCGRCQHLESGNVEYSTWRNCKRGTGSAVLDACGLYTPLKKP